MLSTLIFSFPSNSKRNRVPASAKLAIKSLRRSKSAVNSDAYGEVVPSDIPLYEALLVADYSAIAVVVVVGSPESVDIQAAKALSAKYPLPWVGIGRMPPGAESPSPFGNLRNTTSRIEPQLVRFRRRPINCLSQNE